MGERKIRGEAMQVRTPGGVVDVRWDERGTATAMGQLAFFAEYLEATGLFEGWLRTCPLKYSSPNAPALVDVLGTWMLSILDGYCHYAHVGALRGDGVATQILGMNKIIGDDSLRRALGAIAPEPRAQHSEEQRQAQQAQVARAVQWMQQHLRRSVDAALYTPWILDCDTTIKVLYGRQQAGAVVSYNPHKPGRPSHAIHTYWVGNLRMVLDAALESGDHHAPKHTRAGLVALLEDLPQEQRPRLVRGDCAFGNEGDMNALEELDQPYLFKLRQSVGVKKLIKQQWQRDDWVPVGQGWQWKAHPSLMAVTLLEELQRRHPEQFGDSVLRTLQRRVGQWSAEHGDEREIYFAQEHPPGRLGLSDLTVADELGISLGGLAFPHRLYQFALAHSGWRHVRVVLGASL